MRRSAGASGDATGGGLDPTGRSARCHLDTMRCSLGAALHATGSGLGSTLDGLLNLLDNTRTLGLRLGALARERAHQAEDECDGC